jgi:23S rRNA pseudouridine1911/1915/1917 synthase
MHLFLSYALMSTTQTAFGSSRPVVGGLISRCARSSCWSFARKRCLKCPKFRYSGEFSLSYAYTPPSRHWGALCASHGEKEGQESLQLGAGVDNHVPTEPEDDYVLHEDTDIFTVQEREGGKRLDRLLSERYPAQSRTYCQLLIDEGLVEVNRKITSSKAKKTEVGDQICVKLMTLVRDLPLEPEDIKLCVLYEDPHIVIVDKPAGMVVHPAPGNWTGTMVHGLAFRYKEVLELGGPRPGVVHRLDKGTSGVIIAARTAQAHLALTVMFAERLVEKSYLAVTVGNPAGIGCISTQVDVPIGRSRVDRLRMTIMAEEAGGKPARSLVEVLAHDERALLHFVRIGLETGRTHQIRVHLRHVRAPVLGDDVYGAFDVNRRFRSAAERTMLHAHRIRFKHPITMEEIDVMAPLPDDMRKLLLRTVYPKLEEDHPEW